MPRLAAWALVRVSVPVVPHGPIPQALEVAEEDELALETLVEPGERLHTNHDL